MGNWYWLCTYNEMYKCPKEIIRIRTFWARHKDDTQSKPLQVSESALLKPLKVYLVVYGISKCKITLSVSWTCDFQEKM